MPVMVALNIVRVFAVLFLMLAAEGRLPGPFPYSAAWGDILTGVLAVPVLWLLKDGNARYTTAIAAWNLFGAADLVLAIAFGTLVNRAFHSASSMAPFVGQPWRTSIASTRQPVVLGSPPTDSPTILCGGLSTGGWRTTGWKKCRCSRWKRCARPAHRSSQSSS